MSTPDLKLRAAILKPARTLTDATRKYELATSVPSEVTALGWSIIALDLRRFGSSDLTIWRAERCEQQATALRERDARPATDLQWIPVIGGAL